MLNKSYVLLVNELEAIYARNYELASIQANPAWKYFDVLEGFTWDINQHVHENQNDSGQSHNAQVNKLCIIAGIETPRFTRTIQTIIDDADKAILTYKAQLEEQKEQSRQKAASERNWFIPEYKVTYDMNGAIMINDVLMLKRVHAGSVPDRLMAQATESPNKVFKPDLGNTKRSLSTTLSGMGFSGTLKLLFFPIVSKDKGVLFRPTVSYTTAKADRIDTTNLDAQLKELGAYTKRKPKEETFWT